MIFPDFKKLPDYMLIKYGNRLDSIMSSLVNKDKDDTMTYKLALILQKTIDNELYNRYQSA